MVNLYRLIANCLVLVVVTLSAHAADPVCYEYRSNGSPWVPTKEQACTAGGLLKLAVINSQPGHSWSIFSPFTPSGTQCNGTLVLNVAVGALLPGQKSYETTALETKTAVCKPPISADQSICSTFISTENSTLGSGILNVNKKWDGRVADGYDTCLALEGMTPGRGCKAFFEKEKEYAYGDNWVTEGALRSVAPEGVDMSCTVGTEQDPPKEEKCKDGYTGTVNNVEVCIDKPIDTGTETPKPDEEETNDGTNTTKKKTEKTTTCDGKSCTTTTTTTTTVTNNSSGSSVTNVTNSSTSQGLADFCKSNASSQFCKGDKPSSFTGSCESGYACTGDAIQCAIVKEQHKQWCELNAETDESALYATAKAMTGSVTGDLEGNQEIDISSYFTNNDMFGMGGGSCFPDKTIEVMGKTIAIPFSSVCPYIGILGNILVLISCITAARIVTRKA